MIQTAVRADSIFRPAAVPPAPQSTESIHAGKTKAWLVALVVAVLVLLTRIALICSFGSSVPFWDQWGAEGTAIYKPLVEGHYDWRHLWTAHNEHRIALTRLFAMLIFELNDQQWDVRVQCIANSAILALYVGLFAYYVQRRLQPGHAACLCLLLVLAGALPFSWENTIAGFQNGFYFLGLLTLLTLWGVAHLRGTPATFLLLCVLSLLSICTVATGMLTLLAGVFVLGLRVICRRNSVAGAVTLAFPLLVGFVASALTTPQLEHHQALKAQGLLDLLKVSSITTSWPLFFPAAMVFAIPFLAFLQRVWRERRITSVDLFFAGLFVWSALNAAAVAYSRGNGLLIVPSRYTDLLALGSIAYAYFALTLPSSNTALNEMLRKAVRTGVPLGIAAGFVLQSAIYLPSLRERHFITRIGAVNVRAFVEGDATALTGKPPFYIPFPDAAALGGALSDPTVRALLPLSIRSGDVPAGRLSKIAYALWKRLAWPVLPRFEPTAAASGMHEPVRCAIDTLNGDKPQSGTVFSVPYAAAIRLAGWTGLSGTGPGPRPVEIHLRGINGSGYSISTRARQQRPDVEAAYKDDAFAWSGFDVAADAGSLPRGRYRILLGDLGAGFCDTGHDLDIRNDSDERLSY